MAAARNIWLRDLGADTGETVRRTPGGTTDHELLERILSEILELRTEVQALHRGRAGLDKGRARAIRKAQARGAYTRHLVVELAAADIQMGLPERGRAGRIAGLARGRVSESQARRILRTLSSMPDPLSSNSR